MPTNASGVFTLPASTWVNSGDTVLPDQHNPPFKDVEQGLTDRMMRDGRAPMTGNLAMNGNRITGLGAPTQASHAVSRSYLDTLAVNSGDGFKNGGTLSTSRTLAVDDTVARKNIDNAFSVPQSVSGSFTVIDPVNNANLWLRAGSDTTGAVIFRSSSDDILRIRAYTKNGASFSTATMSPDGAFSAPIFSGSGSGLTGLNAGSLATGAVPDARLPATAVRTSRNINTGDGLTGGGDLSGNRTLAMDSMVVRTSRQVAAGRGWQRPVGRGCAFL